MPHGLAKHTTQSYKRVTLAQKSTIADGLKHDLKPSIIKKKLPKLDPVNLVENISDLFKFTLLNYL
jgi:hypothetical protein